MKKINGFINSNVLTENGIIKTNIIIKDGIIFSIGNEVVDNMIALNDDLIIVPGFIDQHMHGCFGSEVMDGSVTSLKNIAKGISKEGVTSFIATTSTNSIQMIDKALIAIKDYIADDYKDLPELLGAHLEGPFISHIYKGAHLEEYIIKPNIDVMSHFIDVSGNNICLITFAPEEDEVNDFLKYLNDKKIIPLIGHSNATFDEVKNYVAEGVKCITHTYNAQKGIHHRDLGVVGAALLMDEVYTELICDGVHVSVPAVRLLQKNKPLDKLILITDSLSVKGLEDGVYQEQDQTIYVKNNEPRLIDGTLAGSTLTMNHAIRNIIKFANVKLEDAIKFATENPAKNLNIFDKVGSIKEGKFANFVVIDKDINVYQTIRLGNIIYKKE